MGGLVALIATAGAASASVGDSVRSTQPGGYHQVPLVLGGLGQARDLGPVDASALRTIGVFLSRPDPAAEEALYAGQYDPASPDYHRFLTPSRFAQRFGVPAARRSATVAWLRSGGLRVATTGDDYLTATGTVGEMDRLFSVRINTYSLGGVRFSANNAAPRAPISLPIETVVGLDSLHRFSLPAAAGTGRAGGSMATGSSRAASSPGSSRAAAGSPGSSRAVSSDSGYDGVLTPEQLWGIYDQPASDTGQGQTIGVFGEGQTSAVIANLRLFEAHFGLPRVPVKVIRTEPGTEADYGDNSGDTEWYLDTQASTGMAPGVAQLDLYFAKSLMDADIYADLSAWVNDPKGPEEMDASFGECEADPLDGLLNPASDTPYGLGMGNELQVDLGGEQILRQAALEGRTLFSSAGDGGSGCPEVGVPVLGAGNGLVIQPVPEVEYPAASDYAVGVGGTVLSADSDTGDQRSAEVSWTFTGGGSSHFIPEPSFQKGIKAVDQDCLSEPDGSSYGGSQVCRGVPDVATMSGNSLGNGYSIYIDENLSSEGGTSLSSPLMLGLWARIQAAAAAAGKGDLGFADPALYSAAARNSHAFYDVTAAETPAGNGAYRPAAGWDYTSGLGVPDVGQLIRTIVGSVPRHLASSPAGPAPELVCTADLSSPDGNATDPVTELSEDPGLDITGASLTTKGADLVVTATGPFVTGANPASATAGRDLYLMWSLDPPASGGRAGAAAGPPAEYGVDAHFDNLGLVTVTTGESTGSVADGYEFTPSATTAATYSVKGDTITITAPLREVGSPAKGTLLGYPVASMVEDIGTPNGAGSPYLALPTTADTAATPGSGIDPSVGQAVRVGC